MKHLKHIKPLALSVLMVGLSSIAQPIWGYWGHTEPICDPITKAWNYETKSWMSSIPDETKLGDITMPSSHDAGMDEDRDQPAHVSIAYATQFKSILEQMQCGSRFFDIRVKWIDGEFRCAHGGSGVYEYGYNMPEVLDQAVQFVTENPSETVILKFSHWQDNEVLSALGIIFKENKWTDHFYKAGSGTPPILNEVPLSKLRGKIIFLLDYDYGIADEPENALDHEVAKTEGYTPAKGTWRFGELAEGTKGMYGYYRVYDSYAEDNEYAVMVDDQRNKWSRFLKDFKNQTDNAFMVCWQLTGTIGSLEVYKFAEEINPKLDSDLTHLIQLFAERPRLVNLDYIDENVCNSIINANLPLVQKVDVPPVPYLDPVFVDGKLTGYETKYCEKYSILTGTYSNKWTIDLEDRWYVVDGSCSTTYSVYVSGDAHIILKNNSSLSVSPRADTHWAGIMTRSSTAYPTSALTIYGQSTDVSVMGTLSAQGDTYGAGIGGEQDWPGHNITINGGKVTATGGENGAGIGGGKNSDGCDIIINGGYITANSGGKSAGIGGGYGGSGHRITINGGYITAKGYDGGAAIGGGEQYNGGGAGDGIVINGGTIDARTAWHTHNIGSGNDGPKKADDVKFNGGNILAKSSDTWGPYEPINGASQRVYEVTVPDCGTSSDPILVIGLAGYGINDLYQIDGQMKFWLPNGDYIFQISDKIYTATVNNNSTEASKLEAIPVTIGESGYASVYSDKKLYIPSDLQVFVYSFDEGSNALIPEEVPSGSTLPEEIGFVVKAPAGTHYLYDYSSKEAGEFTSVLSGVLTDTPRSEIAEPDDKIYVLGTIEGNTTFYIFTGNTLPGGKAFYLAD